jgi:hypothetical protein
MNLTWFYIFPSSHIICIGPQPMPYTRAVFNYVQFSVLQFFADQIQRLRIAPETKSEKVKREYDPFSLIVYVPHPHSCPPNLTSALCQALQLSSFFSFLPSTISTTLLFYKTWRISAELMETSHGCKLKWSTLLKRGFKSGPELGNHVVVTFYVIFLD